MSQFMKIFKQNSKILPPIKSVLIQIVKIWDYNVNKWDGIRQSLSRC